MLALLVVVVVAAPPLPPGATSRLAGLGLVTELVIDDGWLHVSRGPVTMAYSLPTLKPAPKPRKRPKSRSLTGKLKARRLGGDCRAEHQGAEVYAGGVGKKGGVVLLQGGVAFHLRLDSPGPAALSDRWLAIGQGSDVLLFDRTQIPGAWTRAKSTVKGNCRRPLTDKERARALRRQKLAQRVKNTSILKTIGARGTTGGTIQDAFAEDSTLRDGKLDEALRVEVARRGERSGERAPRTGTIARRKDETRTAPTIASRVEVMGTDDRIVLRRHAVLRVCHERALKKSADAVGTLRVRVVIGELGRPTRVEVPDPPAVLEDVARCVSSKIRRWRFPAKETELKFQVKFSRR